MKTNLQPTKKYLLELVKTEHFETVGGILTPKKGFNQTDPDDTGSELKKYKVVALPKDNKLELACGDTVLALSIGLQLVALDDKTYYFCDPRNICLKWT